MRTMQFPAALLAALALAVMLGCEMGPTEASGTGKVLYQGAAVTAGDVNFFSKEKGVGAMTKLDAAGEFKLPAGLQAGQYAVYVTPPVGAPPPPGTPALKATSPEIPQRARDPMTSGVVVALEGGENEVMVELLD